MDLRAVVDEFIEGYAVYPKDGNAAYAATGEPFLTVTSSEEDKQEGRPVSAVYPSKNEAVKSYHQILIELKKKYPPVEGYVLYWRMRPQHEEHEGKHIIYSRLLLSRVEIDEEDNADI